MNSEGVWRAHPDKPIPAKHAVQSAALLAQFYRTIGDRKNADKVCDQALKILDDAFPSVRNEPWVVEFSIPLLYAKSQVLSELGKNSEAIEFLTRVISERQMLTERFPDLYSPDGESLYRDQFLALLRKTRLSSETAK